MRGPREHIHRQFLLSRREAMATLASASVLAATGASAASASTSSGTAPGAPGAEADYLPADKHGFGTSTSPGARCGSPSKAGY